MPPASDTLGLSPEELSELVRRALAEDLGAGDLTTKWTVEPGARARGTFVSQQEAVVAGLGVAAAVFRELERAADFWILAGEGSLVKPGAAIAEVRGAAATLLAGERVALNLIQHLSGIATLTRLFKEQLAGLKSELLDTRKTTPGLRRLEKYAVTCGGGHNHRLGLFDQVLIKDNHLAALQNTSTNPIAAAVKCARDQYPKQRIEVEADTLEQVEQALAAGADIVLLDNMNLVQLRVAVQHARGRAKTEASGGVNLGTVRQIAETGVDYISVGALTHSARAVDIALEVQP